MYVKQEFNWSVKNVLTNENCCLSMHDSKNSEVKIDINNKCSLNKLFLQTLIVRAKRENNLGYFLHSITDTGY